MLTQSRSSVARFAAVARRLAPPRTKGPPPTIIAFEDRDHRTLAARHEGIVLALTLPERGPAVPEVVTLDRENIADKALSIATASDSDVLFECPARPKRVRPQSQELLTALHACGQSTTRDPVRYALNRIQLRGSADEVIGSDSKQALVWGGFDFPFTGDVLVPVLSVFGTKEWSGETAVTIGSTEAHVVVTAGPWTVWLPIDRTGRYPDVGSCIPRSHTATTVTLSETDAALLVSTLPTLPGQDNDNRPITFDATTIPVVRVSEGEGTPVEVPLTTSKVVRGSAIVALDRTTLTRALMLGLREVHIRDSEKPVVFRDAKRTFVVMPLDSQHIVTADTSVLTIPSRVTAVALVPDRRIAAVKAETNGPAEPASDESDPLTAAEELRSTLAAATQAAQRLVQSLKSKKKEHRALTQVWSSLRSLKLPP